MKLGALAVGCGLVLALWLSASTGAASADAKAACTVTCKAHQVEAGQIVVQIKIMRGQGDKASVISAPTITMLDGQRALVQVGQVKQTAPGQPPKGADEITDGLRVEVIKAVGQDHVIAVTTILEGGRITFAQAQTTPVEK